MKLLLVFTEVIGNEIIVGITRGGLVPTVHKLNIQMHTLDVRLRDADGIGPKATHG